MHCSWTAKGSLKTNVLRHCLPQRCVRYVCVCVCIHPYTYTAYAVYESFLVVLDGSKKLKTLSFVVLYFGSVLTNLISPTFSSVAACVGFDSQQNHAFGPTSPVVPYIWLHLWDMWVWLSSAFRYFVWFSPFFSRNFFFQVLVGANKIKAVRQAITSSYFNFAQGGAFSQAVLREALQIVNGMCVHIRVSWCTSMYACARKRRCVCMYASMRVFLRDMMSTCSCRILLVSNTIGCIHTLLHTHVNLFVCVCVFIQIHLHVQIHTYNLTAPAALFACGTWRLGKRI